MKDNLNEMWELMKERKSFWMLPIVAVLAMLFILLWFAGVPANLLFM